MRHSEITFELQELKRLGIIKTWAYINKRWVIEFRDYFNGRDETVPFTTPQVCAYISGVSCGMGWVVKVAEEVKAEGLVS